MACFIIWYGAAVVYASQTMPSRPQDARPLTQITQVRQLSHERAEQSVPVQVHGVVTAFSGYKNSFFVQDETSGISVDRTDTADVHVGDQVGITGVSGAGSFAPVILASQVTVLGRAASPPALHASFADLMGGAQDSQRVEIHGVVHSARMVKVFERDTLSVGIDIDGYLVNVLLQDFAGMDYMPLIDATVRVRGICSSGFNEKRQFTGLNLFVPDRNDLVVDHLAGDPFAGPSRPVRNALQFGQSMHRVKISGIVTYQVPGHVVFLQDGNDGIRVLTSSKDAIPLGSRVEAVGFPAMGEYDPILKEGLFRVVAFPVPVAPILIHPRNVVFQENGFPKALYDAQLVQVEGEIVENQAHGGERTWILHDGSDVFGAHLVRADSRPLKNISSGSVVRLVGICTIVADEDRQPVAFQILLRSASDITVVHRASWWTPSHTVSLLGTLAGITIAVVLWVVVLKKRVEKQTEIIRESEGRFRDLAQRDVLTGLPNRLMLEERIAECLRRCEQEGKIAAIFTIDIDRFKQINDTYGHPTGDECLKIVAARLRSAVRQTDTIARTGGEEFTLVAGSLDTPESAWEIASMIINLFRDPMMLRDQEIAVTVSVGGALYPSEGTDSEILRKRSDQALYEAKRTGRNRAVFATEELCVSLEAAGTIEAALREALRVGAFQLVYQPIYDASGTIRRFEALLRTTHERLLQLGPAGYIPVAESTGLILVLGRWVLEEACRQIGAWQTAGMNPYPVAINISAHQLLHTDFADDVLAALDRYGIAPELLELELTETAAMTELASVADKVAQLARAGVTFSIDDFGTGYSSLARLHELPIKALKIDRSFVEGLEEHRGTYTIIMAVIQMARSLKIQVVAEGVETEAQFRLLVSLGCDFFQGYLFSKPVPAAGVMAFVQSDAAASKASRPSAIASLPSELSRAS